ncbi:MAG: hypothetical protein CTY15_06590 [Methylocystis sp.]|nr:MAG: hypothetical protein CTY15_06590 [Methylocystis sp.]
MHPCLQNDSGDVRLALASNSKAYQMLATFWPHADRCIVLLFFSMDLVKLHLDPSRAVTSLALPLFVLVYVFRSPPLAPPLPNMLGLAGLAFSFVAPALFEAPSPAALDRIGFASAIAVALYLALLLWSYYEMRNSFAIFPSRRAVVDKGPFRFVRHPMYSAYLHLCLVYAIITLSPVNFLLTAIFAAGLILRLRNEEELLLESPAYASFAERVRFRLFHPLLTAPLALVAGETMLA